MSETITIWHNQSAMTVYREVADALGIKHGHRIRSLAEFWEILEANCEYGIASCEVELGKAVVN